ASRQAAPRRRYGVHPAGWGLCPLPLLPALARAARGGRLRDDPEHRHRELTPPDARSQRNPGPGHVGLRRHVPGCNAGRLPAGGIDRRRARRARRSRHGRRGHASGARQLGLAFVAAGGGLTVEWAELRRLRAALLDWYDENRRELPWRAAPGESADPYRVWLSEVMLQQT